MSLDPKGSALVVPGRTPEERVQHRLQAVEAATGSTWRGETGWTELSLGSGWANYGASHYNAAWRRDAAGRIWMRGLVKNTGFVTATICTLPTGARPGGVGQHYAIAMTGQLGVIRVDAGNGNVDWSYGLTDWIDLCPISFQPVN